MCMPPLQGKALVTMLRQNSNCMLHLVYQLMTTCGILTQCHGIAGAMNVGKDDNRHQQMPPPTQAHPEQKKTFIQWPLVHHTYKMHQQGHDMKQCPKKVQRYTKKQTYHWCIYRHISYYNMPPVYFLRQRYCSCTEFFILKSLEAFYIPSRHELNLAMKKMISTSFLALHASIKVIKRWKHMPWRGY